MADETTQATSGTEAATTQQAAVAEQSGTATLAPEIQAMIEAERQKAYNAGAAAARKSLEGQGKSKQPSGSKQTEAAAPAAADDFADQLQDALDDLPALDKGKRRLVRDIAKGQRPQDVKAFVQDFAAKAGWLSQETPTVTTPKTTTGPAAQPPSTTRPASDTGSTAGAPQDQPSTVERWSQEDVQRFYAQEGAAPDMYDPRNSKIHRKLRDMAKARLANMRFALGPPRR